MPRRHDDTPKIDPREFKVKEGERVRLAQLATSIPAVYASDHDYEAQLARHVRRLSELQELLYASDVYALLAVFQGMDTSGKDGAIKHVMSGVNPQGCQVTSFRRPSGSELEHDFLWRAARELPERGRIGIFNRSYYEEVVVVRVHPDLLDAQAIPADSRGDKLWRARFKSIKGFEAHLFRGGMQVVKFFLHLSKQEQRKRLLARLDESDKQWKFRAGDLDERKCWSDYMKAYSASIEATSTRESPWYVVPADDKRTARLIVSQVLIETLGALDMHYPEMAAEDKRRLHSFRADLER
ncbi:MAG TPA: PPK2 family polyphosphate kinase [Casimicrobiaceae bacterium]|nr:PPK2 family polyphosphate kinase [Casimicrobiaceae bacterium]